MVSGAIEYHPAQYCSNSFVINVGSSAADPRNTFHHHCSSSSSFRLFPTMKIFSRFGKFIMRLMLSPVSPRHKRRPAGAAAAADRFDPPKTSCSSYYSSQTHYSEAIADCIDFFNKSSSTSQDDHAININAHHLLHHKSSSDHVFV